MWVCIYIYIYIYIRAEIGVSLLIPLSLSISVWMNTYVDKCISMFLHVYMWVSTCVCVWAFMHLWMYVYILLNVTYVYLFWYPWTLINLKCCTFLSILPSYIFRFTRSFYSRNEIRRHLLINSQFSSLVFAAQIRSPTDFFTFFFFNSCLLFDNQFLTQYQIIFLLSSNLFFNVYYSQLMIYSKTFPFNI